MESVIESEFGIPGLAGVFKLYVSVSVCRCNQCGRASPLPSRFYELELNIQGHKNLADCITEFLKVASIQWI